MLLLNGTVQQHAHAHSLYVQAIAGLDCGISIYAQGLYKDS
uniref:Uncharacterized protein n=1 Tax=Anguilla anguilla TaxID=7936 RepID=A0A0E9RR35_ANGAN